MIPVARPHIGDEEQAAVRDVLASGQLAAGPVTRAFEQEFAAAMGNAHGVACANGTVAIQVALQALGIGPGDEVIVPGFTFIATANAVLYAGATPVLCDVDPYTFNLDPQAARRAMTPKTRAILPVHLYGLPADMDALGELAERHGVGLLGDAAQAHGAAWRGKPVSAWADATTWSFYPTKNMTTGEGGMVTTDDAELAGLLRSIVNHGRAADALGVYDHVRLGGNFRLSDLHSAIGRAQLRRLEAANAARLRHARRYDAAFAGLSRIAPPRVPPEAGHVYHQYTLVCENRDAVRRHLERAGVGSAVYYPRALADHAHLAAVPSDGLRHARRLAGKVLSIPVRPGLTDAEVEHVARAVRDADAAQ